MTRTPATILCLLAATSVGIGAAVLKTATADGFARYVRITEQRIDRETGGAGSFLWIDGQPADQREGLHRGLRQGGVVIERLETRDGSKEIEAPDGLIHHWVGLVFVPGVHVQDAVSLMQAYDRHSTYFGPNIARSKILDRNAGSFRVALRFHVKKVITVTLDTENHAEFVRAAADRAYSRIRSTRVTEIANAGTPQERPTEAGDAHGFMWNLNTYWRFLERDGKVPNSFNRSAFGEVGLSTTSDNGYFGGSYAVDISHYGIPLVEEGETNLTPRRQIVNIRGERRNMGSVFQSLRGSFGGRRYKHDEQAGDQVVTSFRNNTTELELLGGLRQMGRMKGSLGGSVLTRQFATAGEESLSPEVEQKGFAAYLYEEVAASPHATLQFGGRVEHQRFTPKTDEPARDFTNFSGSIGLLLTPNDAATVAFSLARAARNPALEELYFHGPHPGNFAIENGDADLQAEAGLGFDASLRWRHAAASGEVTFFVNQIDKVIVRRITGEVEEELPVTVFTQGDARLQGVESHVDFRLGDYIWAEEGLDYVHGQLSSIDQPLPRMPPLRGRVGLRFQKDAFQAGLQESITSRQDRIYAVDGVGETPSNGYKLLKLFASYSFGRATTVNTISVRLDNAAGAGYFNHLNYLKDVLAENELAEVGRDFRVVYSVKF